MTTRRFLLRRAAAVAAAISSAVVLAACGADSSASHVGHDTKAGDSASASPGSVGRSRHNAQDVAFAQGMIPHHRQAVAMAELAPSRARSQDVKDLAARIKKAQAPEISTMSGWLEAWGENLPTGDMHGMDHSGHDMHGMMSDAAMEKLRKLSGHAFDTAFLQMMIDHHNGALVQARTERDKGAYAAAKDLAASIIESQSAEITQMRRMLGR